MEITKKEFETVRIKPYPARFYPYEAGRVTLEAGRVKGRPVARKKVCDAANKRVGLAVY